VAQVGALWHRLLLELPHEFGKRHSYTTHNGARSRLWRRSALCAHRLNSRIIFANAIIRSRTTELALAFGLGPPCALIV
jgi:hypothetical protein